MTRRAQILLLALALAGASGCASVPNPDPSDPLEGFNRSVYRFNDAFDRAVAKPVATAYKEVLPNPVRNGVRNFFSNIADLLIGANNLLQGKPEEALTDWMRFAVNTTFGVVGIADWATDMGLDKHNEDFGQTLGRWGVGSGPYVVLPFLGPSDVRDSVGTALDMYIDPVSNHDPGGRAQLRALRCAWPPARRPARREPPARAGGAGPLPVRARRLSAAAPEPDLRRQAAARATVAVSPPAAEWNYVAPH